MMLCQLCKQREATVHFTRIVNQQKVEMYVCKQCARENNEIKLNIHNLLSGIMGFEPDKGVHDTPTVTIKCEACGMTSEEFNKTGMLGCTQCYNAFGESIHTMLKRIHGNVKHHGKVPSNMTVKIQEEKNLLQLKEELEQCIQDENYEQAAVIRDKIKKLEKSKEKTMG